MTPFRRIAAAAILLLTFVTPGRAAEPAAPALETLFQEALMKETGERELDQAIALFRQVVKRRAEDPSLGAKAQLRIAFCYERLNRPQDAVLAYQNVFSDAVSAPADISQVAQSNFERLQNRLEQERANASRPPAPTVAIATPAPVTDPASRIAFAMEGGPLFTKGDRRGITTGQSMFWASIAFPVKASVHAGLEGGHLFPADTKFDRSTERVTTPYYDYEYRFRENQHVSSFYIGPFLEGTRELGRWRLFARVGAGVLKKSVRRDIGYTYTDYLQQSSFTGDYATVEEDQVSPAIPVAIGCEVGLGGAWSFGLGLREMTVFSNDIALASNGLSYTGSSRIRADFALIPFARLALRV